MLQDAKAKLRTPPVTFKMTGFSKKETGEMWSNPPFYSHKGGYKMCLKVYAQGLMLNGDEDHVAMVVFLMKGQNDGDLVWPFRREIKIVLLNQINNYHHNSHEVRFTEKEPDVHNSRVITGERIAAQDLGNESLFLVQSCKVIQLFPTPSTRKMIAFISASLESQYTPVTKRGLAALLNQLPVVTFSLSKVRTITALVLAAIS